MFINDLPLYTSAQLDLYADDTTVTAFADVEFNESDFGQKSAMTTEPDQKIMEVKQNADITAKDEEEVAEIRR